MSKQGKQGSGFSYLPDGCIFKGNFRADKRVGQGTLIYTDGSIYKGNWQDDLPNGLGVVYSSKGDVIETYFELGKMKDGKAKIVVSLPL